MNDNTQVPANDSNTEPARQGQVPPVPQPASGQVPPTPAQPHMNETQKLSGLYPPAQPHTETQPVSSTQHMPVAQPYTGTQPYSQQPAATPSGTPGGSGSGAFNASASAPEKKKSMAMPIIATAALTALLASVATVGVTGLLGDQDPTPAASSQSSQLDQSKGGTVQPIENSTNQNPDWETVTNAVSKTVVAITVESGQSGSEGSGVIIDQEGHIITNNHVVEGANNNEVTVTLSDGRMYVAEITGLDPATDLAVIKIKNPPADLASASFADSDSVTVGSSVLAMGNPLGLSQTATTGIVSALDRPVSTAQTSDGTMVTTNAIQIDAAINPGNSGGPLFNSKGEVIGITSSIATMSGSSGQSGSIGIGFAIPANLAQNISSQLIENGKAEHAFLGVSMSDGSGTVNDETRQGAIVQEVTAGSAAEKAGLKKGDVIVSINDNKVTGAESLTGYVRELRSGDTVTLGVVRDGKATNVQATLTAKTEETTTIPQEEQGGTNPWGQLPGFGGNGDGSGDSGQGNGSDQNQLPGDQGGDSGQGGNSDPSNPNNTPSLEDLQKLFEYFQNGGQ